MRIVTAAHRGILALRTKSRDSSARHAVRGAERVAVHERSSLFVNLKTAKTLPLQSHPVSSPALTSDPLGGPQETPNGVSLSILCHSPHQLPRHAQIELRPLRLPRSHRAFRTHNTISQPLVPRQKLGSNVVMALGACPALMRVASPHAPFCLIRSFFYETAVLLQNRRDRQHGVNRSDQSFTLVTSGG